MYFSFYFALEPGEVSRVDANENLQETDGEETDIPQKAVAMYFACNVQFVHGMDGEQVVNMVNHFATIAQQSATALDRTATIIQTFERATGSADAVGKGLETATRVLRNPEAFDGSADSWLTWRHAFMNWLNYADARVSGLLEEVERKPADDVISVADATEEVKALSTKLYSVVTSYLKGSALQSSRSLGTDRNGFRLWKMLLNQYSPSTRQRSLALPQAIAGFPAFSRDKTFAESIASLEQLVNEYQVACNKEFDREILLGVLMRCAPAGVRQHLTLTLTDGATYESTREQILAYERSSRTWDINSVMRQVQPLQDNGQAGSGRPCANGR